MRTMEQLLIANKHERRVDALLKLAKNISTKELIKYKLVEIKTHRTYGECRNSKLWEQNKLLCKKNGIEVILEDCCENFVPKQIKDCKNCGSNVSFCIKRNTKISHVFGFRDFCSDFQLKEDDKAKVEKLNAAAKKCATTGDRSDLQEYLGLRREML